MKDKQQRAIEQVKERVVHWYAWLAEADALVDKILEHRGGIPVQVAEILEQDRKDLEAREGWIVGLDLVAH